ncbi:hypothetical protein BaRGS_00025170 [Batillaria attramentaria]|uniref:Uncharacterized protein n=1 Tax=Batillaria attramentaria TaxID=370345 RepID=A0ABD0K9A1_9CAEN
MGRGDGLRPTGRRDQVVDKAEEMGRGDGLRPTGRRDQVSGDTDQIMSEVDRPTIEEGLGQVMREEYTGVPDGNYRDTQI